MKGNCQRMVGSATRCSSWLDRRVWNIYSELQKNWQSPSIYFWLVYHLDILSSQSDSVFLLTYLFFFATYPSTLSPSMLLHLSDAASLAALLLLPLSQAQQFSNLPLPVSWPGLSDPCFNALNTTVSCSAVLNRASTRYIAHCAPIVNHFLFDMSLLIRFWLNHL